MPHWYVKAAIQGGIARLPQSQRWNRLFQRHVTKTLDLEDEYFLRKWSECERHLAIFHDAVGDRPNFVVAELGTGWFPITPVGLALAGASRVLSIDTQSLTERQQLVETLEFYDRHLSAGTIVLGAEARTRASAMINDALSGDKSMDEMLTGLGIELLLTDARSVDLPSDSIDLFVSNHTLEHIPGPVITGILAEFRRLGTKDAVMVHNIDLSDHYAGFDGSIGVYNFLQFDEKRWRLFNNDVQYLNRLRMPDFRSIHSEAGWDVYDEDNLQKPVEELRSIALAPEFRHYDEDDLAIYKTWMTSRPLTAA